jgi:outer membrane protein insertion porin family
MVERNRDFMISLRPLSLNSALVCLCGLLAAVPLAAQNTPAAAPAGQPPQQQQPPAAPQPNKNNPFETVPQAPAPQTPATPVLPQFEAPKTAEPGQAQPAVGSNVIEGIEFRGARRVPQDTLRAMIFSKVGDVYNEDTLRRDFMALWNTNRFDDIKLESAKGERGGVVVDFVVTEVRFDIGHSGPV